jgi:uncharacterized OsmC-like protein
MAQRTAERIVNGVNVRDLKKTIGAIQDTPTLGDFTFRITNEWQGGGLNETTVRASSGAGQEFVDRDGKFTMQADEPPVLLSGDQAAGPVEHLLHALASCVTTTAAYHAAARDIHLDSFESSLEGDLDLRGFLGLDPDVPKGYKNITMKVQVNGDLTDEQAREVVQLGCEFSPVYNMVSRAVPINVEVVH